GVLHRRARLRDDGRLVPRRAVRLGGRLPPPHRHEHLEQRRRRSPRSGPRARRRLDHRSRPRRSRCAHRTSRPPQAAVRRRRPLDRGHRSLEHAGHRRPPRHRCGGDAGAVTLHAIASTDDFGAASVVAVLLHGYGSNERDLVGLSAALPAGTPWVSLRAPVAVGPDGWAWFPIGEPGNPAPDVVTTATDSIWEWVDAALPARTRIVPIGFSQGGLMASQLLRTAPGRVIALVIL